MPNLRMIYDNAADRAATLTASTTSGGLVASNMQNNYKGSVHRSTGTSVTYTLTWSTNQTLGGLVLPCTNLSATATVRVRLYSDTAGTTLTYDTGAKTVSGNNNITSLFATLNANTFAYGGLTKASVWFNTKNLGVRRSVIDVVDTANPVGYIDCSKIVLGDYWEPKHNFESGISKSIVDSSSVTRTDSGDLRVDRGTIHETFNFNFALLPESDVEQLENISRFVGTNKYILVSLVPEYDSNKIEEYYTIYGICSNTSVSQIMYKYYKSQLSIESW
jgi:hypothetical protein